jgi:chaperonin GroES
MRKDILASGVARTANYFASGSVDDEIVLHNVAPEGDRDDSAAAPEIRPAALKRRFIPNPGIYLIRQADNATVTYDSVEAGLQSADKGILLIQEDKNKERPSEGFVIEAGKGTTHSVGTLVVFGKYSGTEFRLNGETFLLMKDEDILGSVVIPGTEPIEDYITFEFPDGQVARTIGRS